MWLHHHGHCQFMADSRIYPYSAGLYPGLCHQFTSWGRHQIETFLALLALCVCSPRGRSPVHSPYKGQRHEALMFTLMRTSANCWTNNGGASDWDDVMSMWRHCSMNINCCSVPESLTWFFFINLAMLNVSRRRLQMRLRLFDNQFFYSDKQTQICLRIPISKTLPNK